ncbi:glycosyltransferase [Chloroflexota bacterium]
MDTQDISIIIPAYNAEKTISDCITAVFNLQHNGNIEVLVVNDGSSDRTGEIASSFPNIKVINVPNGGAARATNIGINNTRYDIVVSLDADTILEPDWLKQILPQFSDSAVAVVGGYAYTGNKSLIGRVMGYDVELRMDAIDGETDHLYTMNTAYRREVFSNIGFFNENLRSAYDSDISRRIKAAGYRIRLSREAKCTHFWRDDFKGYMKQQYNYAYYWLYLARKFGYSHNQVTSICMVLNVPLTLFLLLASIMLGWLVSPYSLLILLSLLIIHLPVAIRLVVWKKQASLLAVALFFTLRNFAWIWAVFVWGSRSIYRFVLGLQVIKTKLTSMTGQ